MAQGAENKKNATADFFKALGNGFKEIGTTFIEGDFKTKISFLIFGFGPLLRGQILIGAALLLLEVLFFWFMVGFGWKYLSKIGTLGTVATKKVGRKTVYGDNSFLILLFGVLALFAILAFVAVWYINIRENRKEELLLKSGKRLPTNNEVFMSLFDKNFHKTLLALPVIGIFVFTVLPIVFMIMVTFTYVLIWTLVWAFLATFTNYFLGLAVAMLINKKGIRFKKLWRTILVMTIAVPQFVSLLYVMKMFANDGLINGYLIKWGIIKSYIPFWTDPVLARITVVVVNIWIGIPYMVLIATGLLMNIPEDLYESARIDGANPWQMFKSITLPYMLFVTGPFLLTQYTGNLNNFNVIYLLTQGKPQSVNLAEKAGNTDLLITWLYKMTDNDTNYRMAAVIGIMVFVVTAVISLVVYNMLPSVKDEEGFQ